MIRQPLRAAIERIDAYGWIVFTSQNAVTIFFKHLFAAGRDARCLGACRIAVIGRATGDELLKYGLRPDVVPEQFVAESLLEALDRERNHRQRPFCFPALRMPAIFSLKDYKAGVHLLTASIYTVR